MKTPALLFTQLLSACLALSFLSCTDDDKVIPTDCTGAHWTYEGAEGPENWDDLCVGYMECSGQSQSPVDISHAVAGSGLSAIATNYHESATHILNNGHTIQFNYDTGSEITVNGAVYKLLQFHFHTPSEHTLNGQHYPMEVHLVHKNESTGKLAVIGVFFEDGAENELLKKYLDHLPEHHDETYEAADQFAAAEMLPAGAGYYTYPGSLTTPPCSQIVTWLVMKDHITASHEQILEIEALEHENNRPVQGLNGRTVSIFQ